jgi:hypothetical protein
MVFAAAVFSSSKTTVLDGDIGTAPLVYLVGYAKDFVCTDTAKTHPNNSGKEVPVIAPLSTNTEADYDQA